MSGRSAPQPAWAKLVAVAAVLAIVWILGQTIGPVLAVFVGFIATIALAVFLVISPVRTQIEEIQANLPVYTDQAERQADDLQQLFDRRGIDVDVKETLIFASERFGTSPHGAATPTAAEAGSVPVRADFPAVIRELPTRATGAPGLRPEP